MSKVLERIPGLGLAPVQLDDPQVAELASKVSENLGYHGLDELRTHQHSTFVERDTRHRILSFLEDEFGWLPFTPQSVAGYKAEKADQYRNPNSTWSYFNFDGEVLTVATICSAIVGAAAWLITAFCYWASSRTLLGLSSVDIGLIFFGLMALSSLVATYTTSRKRRSAVALKWYLVPLSDYGPPIPALALKRMLQIKEAFGDTVSFFIDHSTDQGVKSLYSDEKRQRDVDDERHRQAVMEAERQRWLREDPFLVIQVGKEHFHIAVWDEPDFNCELTQ